MQPTLLTKTIRSCLILLLAGFAAWQEAAAQTTTFTYTGAVQTYTVPAGVTSLSVKLWGAGGAGSPDLGGSGGSGAFVSGTLTVTPGQVLYIVTGGGGQTGTTTSAFGGGGAAGGTDIDIYGGGGGGYSGIFSSATLTQANAKAIAGGGGGGGYYDVITYGGAGGATSGSNGGNANGTHTGGKGGTISAGGAAATWNATTRGTAGSALTGGAGASYVIGGGGGGGGYFGGGGGYGSAANSGWYSSGGGGGSSFISPLTSPNNIAGTTNNAGTTALAPNSGDPNYIAGVGNGGAAGASGLYGDDGGNGLVVITAVLPPCGGATASVTGSPVCAGGAVTLNAGDDGLNTYTYSWTGPNGFTSTAKNPTISNITTAAAGTYTVMVSGSGCGSFASVNVVVNPSPVFTATPSAPTTYCLGGTTTITTNDTLYGNTILATPSCTPPNASSTTNTGYYINQVTSTGAITNVTNNSTLAGNRYVDYSGDASKVIVAKAGVPITVTANTSNSMDIMFAADLDNNGTFESTVDANDWNITTFSINVTIVTPGVYRLRVLANYLVNGGLNPCQASGSTTYSTYGEVEDYVIKIVDFPTTPYAYTWSASPSATAGLSSTSGSTVTATPTAAGSYSFSVTATGSNGCTTTQSLPVVTVNGAPAITSQPAAQTICAGSALTLNVAADYASGYQWYGPSGAITGATGSTYTVANATTADAGNYYVVVSGPCGSPATSNTVAVTVTPAAAITSQPADQSLCAGGSFTLSVAASNANAYQWYGPSGAISGATGSSYTVANATTSDAGNYYVTVSGPCGAPVNSNTVAVTVNPGGTWTGAVSTDWNTAGNWCGGIPSATTDVVIPGSAPNQPEIMASASGNARNISLQGATLTVNGTLNLYENLSYSPTGTFSAASGTLNFAGSGAQTVPTAAMTLNALSVTGGGTKTLNSNVTVSGNLTLSSGYVVLNGAVLTMAPAATLTGGSSASYIFAMDAASGLQRTVSGTPVLFPVGTIFGYNPATLSDATTTDVFTVWLSTGVLTGGESGSPVDPSTTYAVDRTWHISAGNPGAHDASVTLQWNAGEYNTMSFDPSEVFMAHYTGSAWVNEGQGAAAGSGPYSFTATGINDFSPFTIVSTASPSPLPVVLVDVKAANEGSRNKISWQSASEDHLKSYVVEKSTDGKTFSRMEEVTAKGRPFGYITYDNAPNAGLTYYRLKMVDQDGTIAYSKTVSAFMNGRGAFALQAAPNPTTGMLTITALGGNSSTAKVQITDVAGHVIAEVAMTDGKAEVNLSSVAAGVYFVKYADGSHSKTIKVTKQ